MTAPKPSKPSPKSRQPTKDFQSEDTYALNLRRRIAMAVREGSWISCDELLERMEEARKRLAAKGVVGNRLHAGEAPEDLVDTAHAYEQDDGQLSDEEIAALRAHSSDAQPRGKVISLKRLF